MNKYNFDDIVNRYNSDSLKYSDSKENILPMWVADMDFHVLPQIKEAIIKRANLDAYGYVEINDEYFSSYQNWLKRRHDIDIPLEYFVFSTGVIASIDTIFRNIVQKGKKILMQSPIYPTFFNCLKNNEMVFVDNPLRYKNGSYEIDWFDLEKKMQEVDAFLLCNPHNPTGISFTKEELNKIARLAKENNVLIISDEIHADIVEKGYSYHSILEVDKEYQDNIIMLFAPSKAFNVASLQTSVAIIPNEKLRKDVQEALWHDDVGEPSYFANDATIAAFNNGDQYIDELNEYIQTNKNYVIRFIKDNNLQLTVTTSHFTYLMWIDISHYSNDSDEFVTSLKNETGLWLSSGKPFNGNGQNFVRLNVATSLKNVQDACERLKRFLSKK